MNDFTTSFKTMLNNVVQSIPDVIAALLLLVLAWIVASIARGIVRKIFVKMGLHKVISRASFIRDEEHGKSILAQVGQVMYFLVFILFLPSILDALNMNSVSQPISNMMNKLLGFIPNLFAAGLILVIGLFIAKLVKDLLQEFFQSLKMDRWLKRINPDQEEGDEKSATLSSILANIIYVVMIIPIVTMALEALNIRTISEPIQDVLSDVLAIVPNLFVAIILLLVGYYLAKFLGNLLTNLLQGTGINNIYRSLGLSETSMPAINLAKLLGTITRVIIMLFFTIEALAVLQLSVLNAIGGAILLYLPFLVSALLILGAGLFLANLLGNLIRKTTKSALSANIVKYIVIVFAVFMTLDQLQFAEQIVNTAFLLILGGLMVAFAISFGIGGREFAKRQLAKFENKQLRGNINENQTSNENDR